jgi:hypothetical protein
MKTRYLFFAFCMSALFANALPPPEKEEMNLQEIQANRISLEGKIIETRISFIEDIEQRKDGTYRAQAWLDVDYDTMHSAWVYFPNDEDAREIMEELAEKSWGSSKTDIYLLVKKANRLEVVGTRYKKSKGVYSW